MDRHLATVVQVGLLNDDAPTSPDGIKAFELAKTDHKYRKFVIVDGDRTILLKATSGE